MTNAVTLPSAGYTLSVTPASEPLTPTPPPSVFVAASGLAPALPPPVTPPPVEELKPSLLSSVAAPRQSAADRAAVREGRRSAALSRDAATPLNIDNPSARTTARHF